MPIDGETTVDPATYIRQQFIDPGLIEVSDIYGQNQCFTPDFLERSLEISRQNLGMETVDIYYLHNVEFVKPQLGDDGFTAMLRAAFERLEEMVVKQRIAYYGIASWVGFRGHPGHQGHLELESIVQLAEEIAGRGHHFRFIQAPFSMMMPEALDRETQTVGGQPMPLVDAVEALRIGLIGSAPLGSGNMLGRWPGVAPEACDLVTGMSPAQQALQFARSVPDFLTNLVGMKTPANLAENLELFAGSMAWEPEDLGRFMEAASQG